MYRFVKGITNLSLILFAFCFLSACKKDGGVIEELLVVTKIDRSINTDYDVMEFHCVNENLCFAFCQKDDLFKLFKTYDGGKNWEEMNNPGFNYEWDLSIQSIVFSDENNGIIVFNNKAYRTYDGGNSWSTDYIRLLPPGDANYAYEFVFAGISGNNEFLLVESNGNSWIPNRIFTTDAASIYYSKIHSFSHQGDQHDYGRLTNGKLFYLTKDFNNWDNKVYMYDFASADMDTLEAYGSIVRDAMYADGRVIFVSEFGQLYFHNTSTYVSYQDNYNFHDQDYNSIDRIDGYYVAVANKSISTNYKGKWQEVINPDGKGHKEDFQRIKRIDDQHFYISGKGGVFLKASFQ